MTSSLALLRLGATLQMAPDQTLRYTVERDGRPVLRPSRLGLRLQGADLAARLAVVSQGQVRQVDERYSPTPPAGNCR